MMALRSAVARRIRCAGSGRFIYNNILRLKMKTEPKEESKKNPKAPADWRITLDKIIEMRKSRTAPVDSKSPGKLADSTEVQEIANFQTFIALMLSPQTRDETTALVMDKLKKHGLTPKSMHEIAEGDLAKLINKVSFYNIKAKHIKQTTDVLIEKHKGKVPDSLKELLDLPGVGKKIAHLTLQLCYGKVEGIAVDTHVHRISNRLGWAKSKKPEETRTQLEKWLPKKLWGEINEILVGFGQEICKPIGPRCSTCLALEFCPYGKSNVGKKAVEAKAKNKKRLRSKATES